MYDDENVHMEMMMRIMKRGAQAARAGWWWWVVWKLPAFPGWFSGQPPQGTRGDAEYPKRASRQCRLVLCVEARLCGWMDAQCLPAMVAGSPRTAHQVGCFLHCCGGTKRGCAEPAGCQAVLYLWRMCAGPSAVSFAVWPVHWARKERNQGGEEIESSGQTPVTTHTVTVRGMVRHVGAACRSLPAMVAKAQSGGLAAAG